MVHNRLESHTSLRVVCKVDLVLIPMHKFLDELSNVLDLWLFHSSFPVIHKVNGPSYIEIETN